MVHTGKLVNLHDFLLSADFYGKKKNAFRNVIRLSNSFDPGRA